MSSYILSECYRLLRNTWSYLFIGICSLLLLSSNIVLAAVSASESKFPYATTAFSFGNVDTSMSLVYILCLTVTGIVFGNEYANHTLKNSISYGINRASIYFGKFIVEVIYAIFAFTIIIGIHILSAYLLLENSGGKELEALIRACLASLPLLISGLATMNCFAFMIENNGGSVAASCGIMIALPLVSNLLGMKFVLFKKLSEVLPWNILSDNKYDEVKDAVILYWDSAKGFKNCWLIGIAETVIIIIIGFLVFRKKEIK